MTYTIVAVISSCNVILKQVQFYIISVCNSYTGHKKDFLGINCTG
uniref:Uncharacterized protein n=1 Tax=Arundo donax TaxID=35708 RepID=A0A0A9EUA4_ARUDO